MSSPIIPNAPMLEPQEYNDDYLLQAVATTPLDEKAQMLEKVLRGELSAIESYEQVLRKFSGKSPRVDEALRSISKDHEEAVFELKQLLRNKGIEPESDSGTWGNIVQAVVTSASLFGEDGAIKALKRGEEHGWSQYQAALDDGTAAHSREHIQNRALPRQKAHIDRLSALLYIRAVTKNIF